MSQKAGFSSLYLRAMADALPSGGIRHCFCWDTEMENAVVSRKCADMLSMLDPLVGEVVLLPGGGAVAYLVGEVAAFVSPDGIIDYISYWDNSIRYRMSLKWAAFLGALRAIRL